MDELRNAVINAIAYLRSTTEFAPKAAEVTSKYVEAWMLAASHLEPAELQESAAAYVSRGNTTYPSVGRLIQIAIEKRIHRNQLASANAVIRDRLALPSGVPSPEDRDAAKARLGITPLDIKMQTRQRERDRGNVGGKMAGRTGQRNIDAGLDPDAAIPIERVTDLLGAVSGRMLPAEVCE